MRAEKKSAPTAVTVRNAKATLRTQFTANSMEKQDLEALLFAEVWDCALKILNDCGGDAVAAKCKISRLVHFAPMERRLKKWMRKMLRTALHYQVTRNLRVPLSALKGAAI